MSEDATRPSGGRFDTPTVVVPAKRGDEETLRERASSGERPAEPRRARSVFDPPRVRFDEQAELGRGGMGRVVEAIDLALDRPVAIKHLLASGDEELARFEREVRITARLQHPSIVPILDAGRDAQGQPFYIMRKIDGEPLSSRVADASTVRDRIALVPAMLGAIDAAAYAHAQGVIHRDIKPWNILLGPFGETLLIDWGIARDLAAAEAAAASDDGAPRDSGLTRVGSAVGTPGFMAPEQARGEAVDRRADVYSLGATLYFVLTGTLPFAGSEATIAISMAAAGGGPDLTKIPPEVPAELTAIVVKALAADRANRYADASELAADLRRFLAGQLVAAHRYTTGERLVRWIRRYRLAAVVSLVAVVAIAVTAILSFRSVVAQRDEARRASALAQARAEELLVDRARSMVSVDPTSAVALLRSLPASSSLWPVAREIVRAAVPAGVERGLPSGGTRHYALAFSPAGRLATSSVDGIEIYDLERRTRRTISKHAAAEVVWRDEQTVVYMEHSSTETTSLGVIDVETGTERSLGPHDVRNLTVARGSIYVQTNQGTIEIFDAALKPERVATGGIFAIDSRSGRVAIVGRNLLVVHEPGKPQRRRTIELPDTAKAIRLSPRGDRVAVLQLDEIYEWQVDGEAPPRRWARSGKHSQDIAYVGETLYAWDDSGAGLVSLETELPITRWSYRGTSLSPAPFDNGMVLATSEGRLAYVSPLGVVEIPHRRLQLKTLAVAPNGRDLVIAALNGELMVVDLRPMQPQLIPVPETTTLYGVTADRLVIGNAPVDPMGSTGATDLAIINLTTGKRTELGSVGFGPFVVVLDTLIVASEGPGAPPLTVNVWDLDGRERARHPFAEMMQVGDGLHATTSMIYGNPDGHLFEQPLDPFGPAQQVRAADGRKIARIQMTPQGLAVATVDFKQKPMRTRIEWIDRGNRAVAPVDVDGFAFSAGYGPDGAMWVVQDVERVVRIATDGTRAVVPLPQAISTIRITGHRIWAIGSSALYELAPDGAIVRTVSLPISNRRGQLRDGIVSLADDGLWVTMPEANVSRLMPIPGGADQLTAQRDGRMVAAITRTEPRYVAIWSDPVPVDPAAVPAYIEQLTNARLDLASSAVTWDRSAAP